MGGVGLHLSEVLLLQGKLLAQAAGSGGEAGLNLHEAVGFGIKCLPARVDVRGVVLGGGFFGAAERSLRVGDLGVSLLDEAVVGLELGEELGAAVLERDKGRGKGFEA